MKIRNIPFGYEIVGGRYVVNNREAEIISSIYNMYLSGKTLFNIAEALTEQEVTYFEDTKVWNKNMVSRILADERYLGNETFPRLVDSNNFNLAKNIRAEKGGKKAVLTPLMATVKDMASEPDKECQVFAEDEFEQYLIKEKGKENEKEQSKK